jgi:hypothetical protein
MVFVVFISYCGAKKSNSFELSKFALTNINKRQNAASYIGMSVM